MENLQRMRRVLVIIMAVGLASAVAGCTVPFVSVSPTGDRWAIVLDGGGNPRGIFTCFAAPALQFLIDFDFTQLCRSDDVYILEPKLGLLQQVELPADLIAGEVAWSTDGQKMLITAANPKECSNLLLVKHLDEAEPLRIMAETSVCPGLLRVPAFSWDAQYISYLIASERFFALRVIDAATGGKIFTLPGALAYEWLPQANELAVFRFDPEDPRAGPQLIKVTCEKTQCLPTQILREFPPMATDEFPAEAASAIMAIIYLLSPPESFFDLSPDGQEVAIVLFQFRGQLDPEDPEASELTISNTLHIMEMAEPNRDRLARPRALYPRYSPLGTKLAFLTDVQVLFREHPQAGQMCLSPSDRPGSEEGPFLCVNNGQFLALLARGATRETAVSALRTTPTQLFWISEEELGYGIVSLFQRANLQLLNVATGKTLDLGASLREAFLRLPTRTLRVPQEYPTIQKAIAAAHPRDRISLAAGDYPENVVITQDLSLAAEPGAEVNISGTVMATSLFPIEVHVQGFSLSGTTPNGLEVRGAVDLKAEGLTISGHREHGILVTGPAHIVLERSRLTGNQGCALFAADSQASFEGGPIEMDNNGADLCGYAPAELRTPLTPQTHRTRVSVPGDYPTIQEAIDAVSPGGTIELGPGIYSSGLTVWKPVMLQGAAQGQTILQGNGSISISILSGVDGVVISDSTIVSRGDGLWSYGSTTLQRSSVRSQGGGVGLTALGQVHVELVDVMFEKTRVGVLAGDTANVDILRGNFSFDLQEFLSTGIELEEQATLHAEQIHIQGASDAITLCEDSSACTARLSLRQSVLENNRMALQLRGSGRAHVQGSLFRGHRTFFFGAIDVSNSAQLELIDSEVVQNEAAGIKAEDQAAVLVRGSQVSRNALGLWLLGSAHVEIRDSVVSENGYGGLQAGFSAQFKTERPKVLIEHSQIERNGLAEACRLTDELCVGVEIGAFSEVTITDAQVAENTDWGVAVRLKKCGYDEDAFLGSVVLAGENRITANNTAGNHQGEICLP